MSRRPWVYEASNRTRLFGSPRSGGQSHRPVFIVGSGRSGNTLMRTVLNATGEIYIPPETYMLPSIIKRWPVYGRLKPKHRIRHILSMLQYSREGAHFGVDFTELYWRLLDSSGPDLSLAQILDGFYLAAAAANAPTATRWGDKTPQNVVAIDAIATVFPDVLIVHMVRDPRDVVASYLEMQRYSDVDSAIDRWRDAVSSARSFGVKHPDRFLEVSYESFVADPATSTELACRFAGLTYTDDLLVRRDRQASTADEQTDLAQLDHYREVLRPIHEKSVASWKRRLTPEQVHRVEQRTAGLGMR